MELLKKGNTYELGIHLTKNGEEIDIEDVERARFKIDNITKEYPSEDVDFDSETNSFIVALTEKETLGIASERIITWEAGIRYKNDEVKRTHVNKLPLEDTTIEEEI